MEEDMLFYQASDSEAYSSGYRNGVAVTLRELRSTADLYLEREESYRLNASTDKERIVAYAKQDAFREVISVINGILEEVSTCM